MSADDVSKEQVLILHDGDLTETVRMLAAAKAIRAHHRTARITLLTGPEFEGMLKHCIYFNAVEPSLRDVAKKGFFERMKLARASHFDVVYDLGSGEAGQKLKGAMRFSRARWIRAVPEPNDPGHPLDIVAGKLGAAGLGKTHYSLGEAPGPEADWIDFVARRSRTLEPAYFGLQNAYVLFAPAGDEVKPAYRWPKERWASLAHQMLQRGIEPAIVGGPSAREIGRYIAHVTPGARDLTGRANLVQLAGLGRRANFAFGEDAGLLHLLVATGAPAVMFHPGEDAPHFRAPRGRHPTLLMHAPTLAQISVAEAVQAMRFAGGFAPAPEAA
ncbi:lipopolysaccharide heptosyltransferase family protein [Marinicauda algicola]|uniref:Lipopolysaccharide heptosyltransferase family protein n=1 Tax=Marinicauda algicola TaxID=2029849 RepID=A0A4S2H064_9PROT|nr:glycosyltransferase family 9 protein [Marinicauda algicola]TGY88905.1 lipopolysaccharide heptosyltransferase family protein [Marinicauda algicola]